ncbi:MAG: hypothetical protein ACPGSC_14290 [Granulosicoccaceae bacterium]
MQASTQHRLAWTSLCLGFIYYLCFRWLPLPLTDITGGSLPSFLFVFSFTLLVPTLPHGLHTLQRSQWLLLTLATEPFFGTASSLDALVAVAGYLAALAISQETLSTQTGTRKSYVLVLMGPLLLTGSYLHDGTEYYYGYEPVYMTYTELRQSVAVEEPREMTEMGRMVVYLDHLFINEKNQGLHVIDNSDPNSPEPLGFIKIPGNTDVSIRNGYLYADSFIDLVVIDINDPQHVAEIYRQIEVFPYDKHQVVGNNYWLDVDQTLGVVVGVK